MPRRLRTLVCTKAKLLKILSIEADEAGQLSRLLAKSENFSSTPHPLTARHHCVGDIAVATPEKYAVGNGVLCPSNATRVAMKDASMFMRYECSAKSRAFLKMLWFIILLQIVESISFSCSWTIWTSKALLCRKDSIQVSWLFHRVSPGSWGFLLPLISDSHAFGLWWLRSLHF